MFHKLIESDNLTALKLLNQNGYNADFIYIDPPYNTNTELTYFDKFGSHENWVNFIKPRLIESQKILSENGVIFVSIDEREYAYLKITMDQVFGEENFISTFIWRKTGQQQNNGKNVSTVTEYILCYAKELFDKNKVKKNLLLKQSIQDRKGISAYRYTETEGEKKGEKFRVNPIQDKTLGKHSWQHINPVSNKVISGNHWRLSYEDFLKLEEAKMIYWGTGKSLPQVKKFLELKPSVLMSNIIDNIYNENGKEQLKSLVKKNFDFPKPVELIKFLIQQTLVKDKEFNVLDFFAGSGTTAHACLELNQSGYKINSISISLNEINEECQNGIFYDILLERVVNLKNKIDSQDEILTNTTF